MATVVFVAEGRIVAERRPAGRSRCDDPGTSPVRVEVEPGTTVQAAARLAGLQLVAPCGGRGRCGKCIVKVDGNAPPPSGLERELLGEKALARGERLACQLRVDRDLVVRLPARAGATFAEILADGECIAFPLDPEVRVREVVLGEPTLADPEADLSRLAKGLGTSIIGGELEALRELPGVLRSGEWRARLVLRGGALLRALPARDPRPCLGAAFDIGTTTVAGAVLDLATGERLATASRTNPQAALGDDVISRMDYAARSRECLNDLQGRIAACLNDLLDELSREAGGSVEDVYDVTVAGNTVMTHLLLGLPPEAMAVVPFVPVVTGPVELPARELGLRAARGANVWAAPAASAYVGGDVIAGLAAVGFGSFADETLYIDIGTNGEVVAGTGARAVCAATAAGPAFEGARISCGMRAVPGAVAHARLRGDELALEVVGRTEPAGLCGTGLVDVVAALVTSGIIDETGRLVPNDRRVREGPAGPEFVVASTERGEITLTQKDIRELQLAKGAIAAGAHVLLSALSLRPEDVRQVLLAGAFGSTIDPSSALAIGLLPAGIPPGRIRAVGNTAASGARLALASRAARAEAERLARWLRPLELSAESEFQARFAEALLFPGAGRST